MKKTRIEWGILAFLLIAAAFLRLHRLGDADLWGDEHLSARSQYLSISRIVLERAERHKDINVEPPGYHILNKAATFFSPDPAEGIFTVKGRFILRLLSALLGIASVGLAARAAKSLMPSSASWIPAALIAMSFYAIYYSQENRPYSALVFATLLCVWFYAEAFLARRAIFAIPYGVATGLIGYLTYPAVMVPMILLIAFAAAFFLRMAFKSWGDVQGPGKREIGTFVAGGLIALALFSPWLPHSWHIAHEPNAFFEPAIMVTGPLIFITKEQILTLVTHWGCGTYGAFFTYVPLLLIGLVPIARRGPGALTLVLSFLIVPVLYLTFSPHSHYVILRYLIFAFPIYQILAGLGVWHLSQAVPLLFPKRAADPQWKRKASRFAAAAILAVLLIQNLVPLVPYYRHPFKCSSSGPMQSDLCRPYILNILSPGQK